MEIVRVIFYYFARGYPDELAHQELCDGYDEFGVRELSKNAVRTVMAFCREVISRRTMRELQEN